MINRAIKTFRKGAHVRYIGDDPHYKECFCDGVYEVRHKYGNMIVGYFPHKPMGEKYRFCEYSMPCKDFEIVIKQNGEWVQVKEA